MISRILFCAAFLAIVAGVASPVFGSYPFHVGWLFAASFVLAVGGVLSGGERS